jgi:PAS domain S-box-containing protein
VNRGSAARILVVDDRPENLLALEAVLEPLGHPIVTATSGDDALRRLLSGDCALILLDVQMPDLDGFATATLIKNHPRTAHIPIIFLTAFDQRLDNAVEGYSSGAVDYVAKPFDPAILQSKVRVFLELHDQRDQLEQQRQELEAHVSDLRASRAALAEAQRIGQFGSWEVDPATGEIRVSAEFRRILGLAANEPIASADQVFAQFRFPASRRQGWDLLSSGAGRNLEGQLVTPDGRIRHVLVNVERVLENGDQRPRIVGTVQDVTEQREAAHALAHARRALERERELVELLQRSVAPSEPPHVDGLDIAHRSRPAKPYLVGGDWYDVVPLEDGRALFVIGDVAGHGISAAATMSQLHTALRLVALDETEPAAILGALNRYLLRAFDTAFTTMIIACLDPATGQCSVASAGHPPIAMHSDSGNEIRWIPVGPPLGTKPACMYPQSTIDVPFQSALVLYTDGLIERRGESLDAGFERLCNELAPPFVSSDELAERLVEELCEAAPRDDVALLVVRRLVDDRAGVAIRTGRRASPSATR